MVFLGILGVVIIFLVLLDAFETIVLPRRVTRHFRLTAWFYRNTWVPWLRLAQRIQSPNRRESFLSYFGPLSVILLLVFWACGLILGFTLLQYGVGEHIKTGGEPITFGLLLYHSGETFFTLGYGDIVPANGPARALAVFEAGMGFAFLGVVIGYLPVDLPGIFGARVGDLDARFAGGIASDRHGVVEPAGMLSRSTCPRPDFSRLGALVGGFAGQSSFLSGAEFFSFAAQQPVVAGRAHGDAGYYFVDPGGD